MRPRHVGTCCTLDRPESAMAWPVAALLGLVTQVLYVTAFTTGENAAMVSRKIRDEFRRSGFHWMSPVEYHNMDKTKNTKPYMFAFLSPRCYLCVGNLEHLATKENQQWLSSLSSQFNAVMVWDNCGVEYVTPDYTPQGHNYVPRTIFAHPNGTMRTDIKSKYAGPHNPHYYLAREMLYKMVLVLNSYRVEQQGENASDLDSDLPS